MRKITKIGEAAKAAARAHTDLNLFYGIIALLEGGLISSDSYPGADRIITICKKEAQKCLRRYDKALDGVAPPADAGSPSVSQTVERGSKE